MPKKRTLDENEMAFEVVSRTIQASKGGHATSAFLSQAARALSKVGASKGGKARARKLKPGRRQEIARKAALSRWSKNR